MLRLSFDAFYGFDHCSASGIILIMSASWIVKPIRDLSVDEIRQWNELRFAQAPLSQTLAWGNAIESLNGNSVVVFSPERKVSAVYVIFEDEAECINGPILNWQSINNAEDLNEQISMAVYALHQGHPYLKTIKIRPRLDQKNFLFLAKNLAFPIDQTDLAQTMLIPIADSEQKQWLQIPPRVRHEINRATHAGVKTESIRFEDGISDFWRKTRSFYESRSLFMPEEPWIHALLNHQNESILEGEIIRASHTDSDSVSEILVLHTFDVSYYFYAHEQRSENCPNISLNACAQWAAIRSSLIKGSLYYDLNGTLHPEHSSPDNNSYSGVDQYKRKFKGKELDYFSPVICFGIRK